MSDNLPKTTRHQGINQRMVPANHATPVSTSVDLTPSSRGLWIGGTGNVHVTMVGGENVTIANVQGGSLIPFSVTTIHSSGTTATDILAVW